jgi:hypothetical protein
MNTSSCLCDFVVGCEFFSTLLGPQGWHFPLSQSEREKEKTSVKTLESSTVTDPVSSADRRMLTNGLTLIALGVSILFLNSWDSLFVRASVGLFWGTFFLILNGPDAVRVFQRLRKKNDRQRRSRYESASR